MLPLEHSAILSTFIKLSFVTKIFVLSIFEWPFYTSFYCTITDIIKLLYDWKPIYKDNSKQTKICCLLKNPNSLWSIFPAKRGIEILLHPFLHTIGKYKSLNL